MGRNGWVGCSRTVTHQSGQLEEIPAYDSWRFVRVSENPGRRRIRFQIILAVQMVTVNLIGIGITVFLVTVIIPASHVLTYAPMWVTFVIR